jgi:hypothetical protein
MWLSRSMLVAVVVVVLGGMLLRQALMDLE